MRVMMIAAACIVVAGCAKDEVKTVEAPEPAPELTRADCYTVVLFDDPQVREPDEQVPAEYADYLGSWTRGAWDGEWCHDLLVTEVTADGAVELYEMHAPHAEWGQPASAFKRTARIDKNGDLRFRYGTETVKYDYVDGKLYAERSGRLGELEAVLIGPDAEIPGERAAVEAAKAAPTQPSAEATADAS